MNITLTTVLIAAIAIGAGVGWYFGPASNWLPFLGAKDTGRLALAEITRTGRPNDALIGPASDLPVEPDAPSPVFSGTPEEVLTRLLSEIEANDSVDWLERDQDGLYARALTHSPLMRFPDINHIWVIPGPDGGSHIVMYAAARLGHSDMGKNRERLLGWMALITK